MSMHNPALGDANEFLGQNIKLIHFVSKRYRNHSLFDETEFFSIGLWALTKAYEQFDPDRSGKFSTFAVWVLHNQYRRYIRNMSLQKRNPGSTIASLDAAYLSDGDGKDITLEDMLPTFGDFTQSMVDEFISTLTDRERRVLSLKQQGWTQYEIANEIGMSQVFVSRALNRIGTRYMRGDWYKKKNVSPKPKEEESMRVDAWTLEDDETLTRTVMDFIRQGRTQLDAFEEAAQILGRTAQSCGFRWNGKLRKAHNDEIAEIRPQCKDKPMGTTLMVDSKLHKKVKVYSAIKDMPIADVVNEAIREYLEKRWDASLLESV